MHLYIVTGGIGKHAMFTSLIEGLVEKHEENISIMSAYPDIFKFHPMVDRSVNFNEPGFYDEFVVKETTQIHYAEPYYSNYAKGQTHLTREWASMHGVPFEPDSEIKTDIWVDDFAVEEAERFRKTHKKFIVTQFSGGQSPINLDMTRPHISGGQSRDYPRDLAQSLVGKIKEVLPDTTILNYALPNEQSANLEGTISIQAPYLFYVALLQMCQTYVCIDSSLMHFAANQWNDRIGVAIWGSTGPNNLGYEKNFNISITDEPSIRPLTKTMGDLFNADRTPWTPDPKDAWFVGPEVLFDEVIKSIEHNAGLAPNGFENVTENLERKNNRIELDDSTRQIVLGLNAQAEGLKAQSANLIDQFVKSRNREGTFVLSNDGKTLVKI